MILYDITQVTGMNLEEKHTDYLAENEQHMLGITQVDSTNRYLTAEIQIRKLPSGFIVYAENQTQGRGHAGNSWESEPYKNLLFSVYCCPTDLSANRSFVISEMASLSVKYTLDKYIPDVTVKWPNDIYYRDKKISGTLIENIIVGEKIEHSVIGTGININQTHFKSDTPNPVSLSQITGMMFDKMVILDEFREIFKEQSGRLKTGCYDDIHNDYLAAIYHKDGYHNYSDENGFFTAKIHHIEHTGHLILERTDGRLSRYGFKEVTFFL